MERESTSDMPVIVTSLKTAWLNVISSIARTNQTSKMECSTKIVKMLHLDALSLPAISSQTTDINV